MVTILIIGRTGPTRDEHARLLEHEGYGVVTADTKPEGLDRVEHACPDLVVLEAGLPGMADHEALGRLICRRPRIPVLFVTVERDEHAEEAADACVLERAADDGRALEHAVRRLMNPHAA
jgi:CheY-like chemotaxis protein